MVNPLLMAMRHNKVSDANDKTLHLPDTLLTLLLADSDPNELGSQRMPQLCQALRYGDGGAVSQLLRFHANPNLCEPGHSEPTFIAIRCASPRLVQLLIGHRADINVQEHFPSAKQMNRMKLFREEEQPLMQPKGCHT